ncbi:cytochrome ubiquinol oxidase subunit I [Actinomycetospora sp. TBRC 11914]|uniref:cytochrome ubiquinol oxidase subunit I n=1 Tax=Actinomycetospora sp. TBRC 11914 TaxID=2729387 RepID=UPI001B7D595E|nr:cytochrome ubiquinol oxidase subunit I [Actinomycetospora sp. TBRC 11914]
MFPPAGQPFLEQARQLQALSFAAHIPLVCFGIAFPVLVLLLEGLHQRTGTVGYRRLARRWSRVMAALFAVGVITGTVLSFEMALLWPAFTATFGSVFGLGFAIEGFSFFTEAVFIGIYLYGWDRLRPRAHLASGVPIAVAGLTGSFMVIAVNAWMNHPGGFTLQDGRVVDVRPAEALFANPYLWHEFVHMYVAAFVVTGFVLAAVYAVSRLRHGDRAHDRLALAVSVTIASVAAPLQVLVGDWAGRAVARYQPVKLAALEGLGQSTAGAPVHVLGWYTGDRVVGGIALPRLLSLLAFHDPSALVIGLDAVPADQVPPVNVVRVSFQAMVGLGTLLAVLGAFSLVVVVRHRRLPTSRWWTRAVVVAGPASVVALLCGWVVTEVGRQPWTVYEVMRTPQAVTAAPGIPVGYAVLGAVYAGVGVAVVWVLRRLAAMPLPEEVRDEPPPGAPLTSSSAGARGGGPA